MATAQLAMRVRASAAAAAAHALRQLRRWKVFFAPSPVSSTREALIPGRSPISSVSPPRPAKSPRASRAFSRPPQAVSTLRASPLSSPSSNTPRTRQSTPSVAKPLVQTPNSMQYPLAVEARVRYDLPYVAPLERLAPLGALLSARGAATAASDGKCNSRARQGLRWARE